MTEETLSYGYIESGVILNVKNYEDLNKIKATPSDFVQHGDALKFIVNHFDDHGEIPDTSLTTSKFTSLDKGAKGAAALDFFLTELNKALKFRATVEAINKHQGSIRDDPEEAANKIIHDLSSALSAYDSDVSVWDSGVLERLDDFKAKAEQRKTGLKMLGIPTPFKTLNRTGLGWMNGEMTSVFARPTAGKSWICCKVAAVAIKYGFKVLVVTTEMSAAQLALRLDAVIGNMYGYKLSHRALRTGDTAGLDLKKYEEFLTMMDKKDLLVTDHIGRDALSVEGVEGLVRKHKPDLVVVDGVYLLKGEPGSKNWEKDAAAFDGFKNMAILRDIPVFITTQATKDASNTFAPPAAHHVANGDALLRYSDIAMSMFRVETDEMQRAFQVQKTRDIETPDDVIVMHWDVDIGDIYEELES